VAATLISDTTYFKMKEGVLVSLEAWTGDIDPYDSLEEAWVQISGIPPRWSNWRTLRQIASSLGKFVGGGLELIVHQLLQHGQSQASM
jgi:hypothetical protein